MVYKIKTYQIPRLIFRALLPLYEKLFLIKLISQVMEERTKAFAKILSARQKRKFQTDKIDLQKALDSFNKILQQLMNKKTPVFNEN